MPLPTGPVNGNVLAGHTDPSNLRSHGWKASASTHQSVLILQFSQTGISPVAASNEADVPTYTSSTTGPRDWAPLPAVPPQMHSSVGSICSDRDTGVVPANLDGSTGATPVISLDFTRQEDAS